ncbi:MAG: hypothetical protein U9N63_08930 [Pseudomonadota bacterium]|nr:hypothetical protein [Pseudomonadota bacterium]
MPFRDIRREGKDGIKYLQLELATGKVKFTALEQAQKRKVGEGKLENQNPEIDLNDKEILKMMSYVLWKLAIAIYVQYGRKRCSYD